MTMNLFKELNKAQQEAINTIAGPLLVIAGAGSGKTRVVTCRIAHMIDQGIPPSKILGLTFTNKAANEMKERVKRLTNSNVLISTFHSLGAKILRESIHHLGYTQDFTIYDDDDTDKLIKACLKEVDVKEKKGDVKTLKSLISKAKNTLDMHNPELEEQAVFSEVFSKYQARLKQSNALDFDDLLLLPVRLFREHRDVLEHYQERYQYLLIDEYQDTNKAQYTLVKLLVGKMQNICVVGDPDQSIYSWRGANIENILNFENDFQGARVIRLEQNYRSRTNILNAANELITFNLSRYDKNLWSDLGPGDKIKRFTGGTDRDEANFVSDQVRYHHEKHNIPLSKMVVFYRTNAQSRSLEDRFLFGRIPYVIIGGISFYQRREIKDILAFLRMVHSGADFISFSRTINIPKRGIGDSTIEKIRAGSEQESVPILDYCRGILQGHVLVKLPAKQEKGLQDYVFIINELKKIGEGCSLKELVREAIELTGYVSHLMQDPESFDDRKENLDALIAKAAEWEETADVPSLSPFLEELALKSSMDEADVSQDRVNLMTLHNGKGLEYPVVFLVGMEEDLLPHANARGRDDALEEERRLCYVGLTRAQEFLYLTNARFRYLWGIERSQRPSRFLNEIPVQYVERVRRSDVAFEEMGTTEETHSQPLAPGDAVFHTEFGAGIVQDSYDGSAGLTYKILFSKEKQPKNIVAKFAQLRKL